MVNYTGEIAILISTVIWAHSLIYYKKFAHDVPPYFLNLYKNTIASIVLLAVVLALGRGSLVFNAQVCWILFSGILGLAIGDFMLFIALEKIGASLSTVIMLFAPIITAICGLLFLGEFLSFIQWFGIIVTSISIMCIVQYRNQSTSLDPTHFKQGVIYAVISSVFQAFGMLAARFAAQGMDVFFAAGLRLWGACAVLMLGLFFVPKKDFIAFKQVLKSSKVIGLTFIAVLGTAFTMILFMHSSQHTKAAITATLGSTTPIWILPGSYFLLKEKISIKTVIYTIIAFLGAGLLFIR